jgi:hypothetical protein
VPNVGGKKYPYTKAGIAAAKKAINEDDARGYRKRVAKAKRIKGETVTKPTKPRSNAKKKPGKPKGEPPNQKKAATKRRFAKNPGDLGKLIKSQQRKKPY